MRSQKGSSTVSAISGTRHMKGSPRMNGRGGEGACGEGVAMGVVFTVSEPAALRRPTVVFT
jgi:hypothetical protein